MLTSTNRSGTSAVGTGTDQSICVVLAALLCLFTEPDNKGTPQLKQSLPQLLPPTAPAHSISASGRLWSSQRHESLDSDNSIQPSQDVQRSSRFSCAHQKSCIHQSGNLRVITEPQRQHPNSDEKSDGEISKALMRQRLAYISSHYPEARPSRGNLKEVYNFARIQSDMVTR